MAYVEPNTTLKLIKGVSIDNRYIHTYYFGNTSEQYAFFNGKAFRTFSYLSYQRAGRGRVRIQANTEGICDTAYIMFQNSSFGNKWFYAFVTSVEYISNECAEIRYELDVMQTWFVGASLGQCYVERMHISSAQDATDTPYHRTPEPVDLGQPKMLPMLDGTRIFTTWYILIASRIPDGDFGGYVYNNQYSGLQYAAFPTTEDGVGDANAYLSQFEETPEDVVQVMMFPADLLDSATENPLITDFQMSVMRPDAIDNYTPRNKKLLYYPYSYLTVTGGSGGQKMDLRFEDGAGSEGREIELSVFGSYAGNGEVYVTASQNGASDNPLHSFVLGNFPQCSFTIDGYRTWLAQQNMKLLNLDWEGTQNFYNRQLQDKALSGVSAIGQAFFQQGGGAAGVGAAIGTFAENALGQYITSKRAAEDMSLALEKIDVTVERAKMLPDHGNIGSSIAAGVTHDDFGIRSFNSCVGAKWAAHLDSFFDAFGYAVETVTTPLYTTRSKANYLKTKNCIVIGDMPAEAKGAIGRIIDGGITFWKSGATIGDYSGNV